MHGKNVFSNNNLKDLQVRLIKKIIITIIAYFSHYIIVFYAYFNIKLTFREDISSLKKS